jgi:ubiquitin-protein ligase
MKPRLRRLSADFERIRSVFADHPYIRLVNTEGNPAEKYVFEFRVPGLVPEGESFVRTGIHSAEVFLPLDYPRRPPFCRMLTPVYHPNIDPQKICIGDHWSAGESLAHLVVRIGEMVCYQSYNVKSPLNRNAAAWAESHMDDLPILKDDLTVGL